MTSPIAPATAPVTVQAAAVAPVPPVPAAGALRLVATSGGPAAAGPQPTPPQTPLRLVTTAAAVDGASAATGCVAPAAVPVPGPAPIIGSVAPADAPALGPAPAIGSVSAAPAIGSVAPADTPAPVIGSVAPADTPSAPPAIGSVGGPLAPAPIIGSVKLTPSQQLDQMENAPAPARRAYEPPTAKIPDAPNPPGKWVPQYTRDMSKYVVPGLDGFARTETFVRATTHAKVLDDSTALTKWQLRGTVLGLARNPELLDSLELSGADHINELDFKAKLALSAVGNAAMRRVGGDDGSDFGTKLHGYVEALIEGVITFAEVPVMFQPYLTVLFAAVRRERLNFVRGMTERTVFIPATGMVGTFDFLLLTANGELIIGDLKTSSSIDYSWLAIGVQLAQYADATMMLSWDGSRWEQMPAVSKVYGAVVAVPKDEPSPIARIYYVDLALGAELVDIATRVQGIHETARRVASSAEMRRPGDELIAWAAGDPVTMADAATML